MRRRLLWIWYHGWKQWYYDGDSHRPQQAEEAGGALCVGASRRGVAGGAGARAGAARLPPAAAVAVPATAAPALRLST